MSRVLVVGPKDQLERVVETLYGLKLIHLLDHRGEDDTFSIGKPLPRAAEISENLVKLRSIASILHVEEAEPAERGANEDVRERIATLELHIREEDESRKKAQALLQDLDRQIEAIRPFAALGLPLDAYHGYDSLAVIVGRVADDVRGLDQAAPEAEVVAANGYVAVFAAKSAEDRVREHLAKFGFSQIDVPPGDGDSKEILARDVADREKWIARLADIEDRIAKLRDRYARFILDAEDRLEVAIEKAEAPLRFAVSEHSFVIDGWVPQSKVQTLVSSLNAIPEILAETIEEGDDHTESEHNPPVLLRNRGPAKRFEFLTSLHSTPRYDEIDPTSFLFIVFPIFFGLMIGDAGYGIIMIALGFGLSLKFRDSQAFADLFRVFFQGGIFAFLFGLLLFGDIFGIPLHAPFDNPREVNWSAILGYDVPYSPPIHKLETVGVIDLIYLSIVASFIHLSLGFVVGFFDEVRHSRKHAASRIGWLFVLLGLFSIFAVLARAPAECATVETEWCTIVEHRVANRLFFDQPPFAWIPGGVFTILGITVPVFTILSVIVGLGILIPTEGPLAITEVISLLANMFSYARLAGVAVAKGAMAVVFNTMLLPFIINEELFIATGRIAFNPNLLLVILGFALMVVAHALVLVLGSISAGVQALRLNYVEFFLKFYKGGGQPFRPFGIPKTQTEV